MCRSPAEVGKAARGNCPSTEVEGTVANPGRTSSKPGEGRADERTAQGPVSFLHEDGERHNGAVTRIGNLARIGNLERIGNLGGKKREEVENIGERD